MKKPGIVDGLNAVIYSVDFVKKYTQIIYWQCCVRAWTYPWYLTWSFWVNEILNLIPNQITHP